MMASKLRIRSLRLRPHHEPSRVESCDNVFIRVATWRPVADWAASRTVSRKPKVTHRDFRPAVSLSRKLDSFPPSSSSSSVCFYDLDSFRPGRVFLLRPHHEPKYLFVNFDTEEELTCNMKNPFFIYIFFYIFDQRLSCKCRSKFLKVAQIGSDLIILNAHNFLPN